MKWFQRLMVCSWRGHSFATMPEVYYRPREARGYPAPEGRITTAGGEMFASSPPERDMQFWWRCQRCRGFVKV